jgi:hypothetical protein
MEPASTRIRLRVSPGAGRSTVVGRHGDAWKVRVAAAPERGRANDSLLDLLAISLGVRRPAVRIVAGASSRDKVVELDGLTVGEVEERLDAARKGSA